MIICICNVKMSPVKSFLPKPGVEVPDVGTRTLKSSNVFLSGGFEKKAASKKWLVGLAEKELILLEDHLLPMTKDSDVEAKVIYLTMQANAYATLWQYGDAKDK